jgi:hypothetical protein
MTIKASGRSALILATALLATGAFVGFAGPSQAAADEEDAAVSSENAAGPPIALNRYTRHGAHQAKRHAHRKSSKVVLTSSASNKAAKVATADTDNSAAISPSAANAYAQMTAADTPAANGKAMSAQASDVPQATPYHSTDAQPAAETQIVSADQLNDVDRALQASKPTPTAFAMASAEPPPVTVGSNESSTWDRTSLIGKIFMGFGALLTMASAVRMFMA